MVIHNQAFKESLVKKVLTSGKSMRVISAEGHVALSTLYGWVHALKSSINVDSEALNLSAKSPSKWTTQERLSTLIATGSLEGEALNQYCRQKGLYTTQLDQWRNDFMNQSSDDKLPKQQAAEIKKLREENKKLERDLRRKEKALAEASALLILKKKADLIWGVDEDD